MRFEANIDLSEIESMVKAWPEVYRAETTSVLKLILERLESEVVPRTPGGVGGEAGLRGSYDNHVRASGEEIVGWFGSLLEYGIVVEMGRRPGQKMPPVAPIELWVRSILGETDPKKARQIAFAIAVKIAKKGTEGKHMLEEGWGAMEPWANRMLETIPERIIRRLSYGV